MDRNDIIKMAREAQQESFAGASGHWFKMEVKDLERFAELIVRECADVLVAEMNRLEGLDRVVASQTMDTAQVLIKQHFGVEE